MHLPWMGLQMYEIQQFQGALPQSITGISLLRIQTAAWYVKFEDCFQIQATFKRLQYLYITGMECS